MPNVPILPIHQATSKTVQHQYSNRSAYCIHNEQDIRARSTIAASDTLLYLHIRLLLERAISSRRCDGKSWALRVSARQPDACCNTTATLAMRLSGSIIVGVILDVISPIEMASGSEAARSRGL
jgi:hypothetical protein